MNQLIGRKSSEKCPWVLAVVLAVAIMLGGVPSANAIIWTGATNDWNLNTNWNGNVTPVDGDVVDFDSTSATLTIDRTNVILAGDSTNMTFGSASDVTGDVTINAAVAYDAILGTFIDASGQTAAITITVAADVACAGGGTVIDTGASTVVLSGAITGGQPLEKLGAGMLTLSGNSTGTIGATTITAGTLSVGGTGVIEGIVVGANTLSVSGTATTVDMGTGAFYLNSGTVTAVTGTTGSLIGEGTTTTITTTGAATIDPGMTVGAVGTFNTGAIDLSAAGAETVKIDINADPAGGAGTAYDLIDAGAAVVNLSTANLAISLGYIPSVGDVFTPIATTNGAAPIAFANATTTYTTNGVTFGVAYTAGTGVVLTVTAVASNATITPSGGQVDDFGDTSGSGSTLGTVSMDGTDNASTSLNTWNETAAPEATFTVARNMSMSFGTDAPTSAIRPMNSAMPGVILAWTTPSDITEEWWLPVGGTGTLANGITWTTTYGMSGVVPYIDVTYALPKAFLDGLANGQHKISYWLRDTDGNDSNKRWENLTIGADAASNIVPRAAGDLIFKLMMSQFVNNTLVKLTEGTATITVNGEVRSTSTITEGGLCELAIPFNETSIITFDCGSLGTVTWQAQYTDGYLSLNNTVYDAGRPIRYYADGAGGYNIDYFRNGIYICGQGDIYGPIAGALRVSR